MRTFRGVIIEATSTLEKHARWVKQCEELSSPGATGWPDSVFSCVSVCKAKAQRSMQSHETPQLLIIESGVRWWQVDLRDVKATRRLLADVRPEVVFHLAGCVTGGRGTGSQYNTESPTQLSDDSKLVCLRSLRLAVDESSWLARSKNRPTEVQEICSSPLCRLQNRRLAPTLGCFIAFYRTPIVNTRIFMVYGPGKQPDARFIPYVISSLLSGKAPKLTSGARKVDWIYIDDLIEQACRLR